MSVPPKVVKAQVIRAGMTAESENLDRELLSLARHYDASPARRRQSLPVLEAFQEFLEMERRRARRRLFVMAMFFVVLFIVLTGAALTAGLLFYGSVADELSIVREEAVSSETRTLEIDRLTQSALSRFASDTAALRDDVLQRTQGFLRDQSGLSDQIGKTADELRALRESLDVLRSENTAMRMRLAELGTATAPGQEVSAEAAPPAFLSVSIQPEGAGQAVPWRLPIP